MDEARRSDGVNFGAALGGIGAAAVLIAGVVLVILTGSNDADTAAMDPPTYVEESAAAGIVHTYDGEFSFFVGGGVAVFDCNDDGKLDLYIAGGSNPAALYRNRSTVGGTLSFDAIASPITDLTMVTGAYPLDVDSDGTTDLAVLRFGENVVLKGLGGCDFERANESWGIDGGDEWTTAFSAKWEGSAALPTLAFGNYIAEDGQQTGECSDHALFRPADAGVYAAPEPLAPGWCTLSILFSDWDRSGRGDLRVTNDRQYYRDGEEQLWRVEEDQPPRLYTEAEGWQHMQIFGMGIASHDVTGDGLPEVFLTSMGDNKLQTLADGAGEPVYEDIALGSGVTAHSPFVGDTTMPSTAWHAEFQDVNNDGYIDLYIAKGNVDAMPEAAIDDPSNLLLGAPDGTFTESAAEAGILSFGRGRGAALADFNLDGMLDLVEVNRRANVKLWRNVGWGDAAVPIQMGNWVAVHLEQPGTNTDAIGSWIEVRFGDLVTHREVTIGGGHAGGQLGWIHFGLGAANSAEVRVQWPDGEVGPWLTLAANEIFVIERGADDPVPWNRPG
jgi:hypothetical protein